VAAIIDTVAQFTAAAAAHPQKRPVAEVSADLADQRTSTPVGRVIANRYGHINIRISA